ncbi:hypothetical protein RJ640_006688 [Escallonia rubra]|uniref:Retrovirus-related Pol polyprotein from transposon TNT 1-94 n=1 Tax=Escallonia rubra TaxID=112253 RepID=A0AA88UBH4_9ASTE|nr:hypothetical protein RJ640_006688 [Escallonia rubra]
MDEGLDLDNHISEFNRLVSQFLSIDVKINEEDQAILLLSSLPKSYETLKTTLLIRKETLLVDDVVSALMDFSRVNGTSSSSQSEVGNDAVCKVMMIGTIKIKILDGIVRTLGDVRLSRTSKRTGAGQQVRSCFDGAAEQQGEEKLLQCQLEQRPERRDFDGNGIPVTGKAMRQRR